VFDSDVILGAAFEIVALVAGTLGPVSLAAQSVIMTSDESTWHCYLLNECRVDQVN
jgi:hypothetical protein